MKIKNYAISTLLLASSFAANAQNETIRQVQSSSSSSETVTSWNQSSMVTRGASYDVLDTNYVPKYRMNQHRRFLNNDYIYPAKPRNMWEVGVSAGLYNYTADVPSLMLWQRGGYGFSAHVRKAWGYVFSTRLQYVYGVAKGIQWQQSENYRNNPAWTDNGYQAAIMDNQGNVTPAKDKINYNYRSTSHQFNVDFMVSSNNIKFHKSRTALSVYGFLGVGAFMFHTMVNALDANGQKYDFTAMLGQYATEQEHKNFRKIEKLLLDQMDNTYETDAENERHKRRPGIFGKNSIDLSYSLGLGVAFRVSQHVNIALEDRILIPHEEDLLDGQRWAEQVYGNPVFSQNNDMVNYFSLGVNFNLGSKKRSVEPLYWLNPLDYMYSSPSVVIGDADKDGVADQFDRCPGTPEGIPVDVNGCPMDTDGDGVPDYRDKQLITPTECQPVDEDGIGKCPCPDCFNNAAVSCSNIPSGMLIFDNNSAKIKSTLQTQLASLATSMKANPNCKVVITGNGGGSKLQEQRSWDRVEAAITFLSERYGIDRSRFVFQYGQPGDPNTISYRSAMEGEDGFSNVPPPFPNLRRD